jgi:hypothetical protein
MYVRSILITAASTAAIGLFAASSASAQATRTWVSGVGDDANPCSRTAPCKTFQGAISKTAAGGEISVLDPGGFGGVTITKSISINGEWNGEAGVLVSGTNGVTINASATDVVNLRGLFFEGIKTSLSPNGVNILSAGEVHMQDLVIRDFHANSNANVGNGVLVAPSANNVKVTIDGSTIVNNGSAIGGAGVLVRPTGAATANVVITNTLLAGNTAGLRADGGGGSGAVKVTVSGSTATASLSMGFHAVSLGSTPVQLFLDNSVSSNNGSVGARVEGAQATLTIGRSSFTGNGSAGMQTLSSGVLNSYRDNHSILNGTADSPTVQVLPN